jgi:hypothetical protein
LVTFGITPLLLPCGLTELGGYRVVLFVYGGLLLAGVLALAIPFCLFVSSRATSAKY